MHCNDWGDRVQHDFYNSNLIFTIQIWSSAGNVQSINFHWFILLGYRGGGKVLVETHLSFFISLPGSLYEAQVDLFTGRTFSHKMLEVVAGAPFIIKWWMAVNSRVTRTQPPITPDMKLTPDFPESILESWCWKVKRGLKGKVFVGAVGLVQPFMQIAWERYICCKITMYYNVQQRRCISISIRAKIETICFEKKNGIRDIIDCLPVY